MTVRRRWGSSFCGIQLSLCAWISIILQLSLVNSLYLPSLVADKSPRAAFVTLTHEDDLPATLFSISQVEDKFNSRFNYNWIFFSTEELSEEFKQSTSNATNATCVYEVTTQENWVAPREDGHGAVRALQGSDLDREDAAEAVPDLDQIYRWHSGPFAQEKRLKDYEWFWKVEPGACLTYDIPFDVFRIMRDNGIAYGFSRASADKTTSRALSNQVRSFIEKHPDLLHAEADVCWLLDASSKPAACRSIRPDRESSAVQDYNHDNLLKTRVISESSASPGDYPCADWQQDLDDVGKDMSDAGSLTEAFTSWLSGIYEYGLYPTFEIGSLAFFRSPNHVAFFDHLDSAGEFSRRRAEDVPIHTLSASMFLPKQSVWNFRKRVSRFNPSPPDPTPDPDPKHRGVEANSTSSIRGCKKESAALAGAMQEAAEAILKQWEKLAGEFGRQNAVPGLRSGNTVIDERNFVLLGPIALDYDI